jgi:hypothetical protein
MPAAGPYPRLEGIAGRQTIAVLEEADTGRQVGKDVQGNNRIYPFKRAVANHSRRPTDIVLIERFFGGLEKEADVTLPALFGQALFKQVGRAEQDGRVRIVAAGVHNAVILRTVGHVVLFQDGQGIHVGAYGNGGTTAATHLTDHAGLADAGTHLHTDFR